MRSVRIALFLSLTAAAWGQATLQGSPCDGNSTGSSQNCAAGGDNGGNQLAGHNPSLYVITFLADADRNPYSASDSVGNTYSTAVTFQYGGLFYAENTSTANNTMSGAVGTGSAQWYLFANQWDSVKTSSPLDTTCT